MQLPAGSGWVRVMKDPRQLSQAELDEYLDQLINEGNDDSPEFHRAHQVWEELNG